MLDQIIDMFTYYPILSLVLLFGAFYIFLKYLDTWIDFRGWWDD